MKLSTFSENIVTETFERSGETVELKLNLDAVVPEYHEVLQERLKPTIKRIGELQAELFSIQSLVQQHDDAVNKPTKKRARLKPFDAPKVSAQISGLNKEMAELQREVHAEKLTCPVSLPNGEATCILKGWDLTDDDGMDLTASKENLLRLPPNAVLAIWEQVERRFTTVKKRVDVEAEETEANTHSGSMALRVVGQRS